MLQSYFQKVHRNLGTFKAFGISTRELIRVYVAIIAGIVILALVIALGVTWLTELLLLLLGIMKDGEYSWLILWNPKTLWAVVIILVATLLSVLFVMRRLLQQTPGDLIYDRN
jgi:ABC-type antimicrobial peptide transport system permease subunit